VKRRSAYFLILAVALSIPFHISYLYYDFYGDLNFHYRKYYTNVDQEDLLTYLKNNPRAIYQPSVSVYTFFLPLETLPFHALPDLVADPKEPVLRC